MYTKKRNSDILKAAREMRKNKKFDKKNEEIINEGPPWTVVARFPTYTEAATKVDKEREPNSDYDYKIKRFKGDFRVKKRLRLGLMEKKKNKKG